VDLRSADQGESRARVRKLVDNWATAEKTELEDRLGDSASKLRGFQEPIAQGKSRMTPAYIALPVIVERMLRNLWRQPPIFWARIQQAPAYAAVLLLFYQRLSHGPSGGQDRIGLVQQIILSLAYVGLLSNIAIYPAERDLYLHEYKTDAAYSPWVFLLAFTIVELPQQIFASLLFGVIGNIAMGLRTSARIFFEYSTVIWALQSCGESLGIMFASFGDTMGLSVSLVSTFLAVISQLNGLLSITMPYWLTVLAWGTPMKYAANVLFVNESRGLRLNCPLETIASGECLAQTGEELLALVRITDWQTGKYTGVIVAIAVLYRVIAWAFVKWRAYRG